MILIKTKTFFFFLQFKHPFFSLRLFKASLKCLSVYQIKDDIVCTFFLTNNGQRDYSVFKLHTPLEGQPSDCLRVTRDGNRIEYDGIFVKRSLPSPEDLLVVPAGKTVSASFDVSAGYDMGEAGIYTVAVDTYLEYVEINAKGNGKPPIPKRVKQLSSLPVMFNVTANSSRKTLGQKARSLEENDLGKRSQIGSAPRDPSMRGGSASQQAAVKEAHRAAYHYIKAAIIDLNRSPERVKTWFGKLSQRVVNVFELMKQSLENDQITYSYGGWHCDSLTFAYTYKYSRNIYLCSMWYSQNMFWGFATKVGIVIHELAHAKGGVSDIVYDVLGCKKLAKEYPHSAANNAESYEIFTETLLPFDHGIDAATTLQDGTTYLFKGNFFVKFKNVAGDNFSQRLPWLLSWSFKDLPEKFARGFDSFVCHKAFGRAFATNGAEYIRFKDANANALSSGYPKPISSGWDLVNVPQFLSGFDSFVQLPNGVTYATKGDSYVRYSNKRIAYVDAGFPKTLNSGEWGSLPENFRSGFDAMLILPNGKLYVFKGSEYIRYSNFPQKGIDSAYPLPIKGNWGKVPQT